MGVRASFCLKHEILLKSKLQVTLMLSFSKDGKAQSPIPTPAVPSPTEVETYTVSLQSQLCWMAFCWGRCVKGVFS